MCDCKFEKPQNPKRPCCELIVGEIQKLYNAATNTGIALNEMISDGLAGNGPLAGISDGEATARVSATDKVIDGVTGAALAAYETLNCNPKAKDCCDFAAPVITNIAINYIGNSSYSSPDLSNPGVLGNLISNPNLTLFTAGNGNALADEIIKDAKAAIDGVLAVVLCPKKCKPCKPWFEKEKCENPWFEREECEKSYYEEECEKPWYLKYKSHKSSSSCSNEEKKKHCKCKSHKKRSHY